MAALTKNEILTQLKKFGVSSSSELNNYFKEYEEYFTLQNSPLDYHQEYCERAEDN